MFRSVLPLGLANSEYAGACDNVKRAACRRSEGETCCDGQEGSGCCLLRAWLLSSLIMEDEKTTSRRGVRKNY